MEDPPNPEPASAEAGAAATADLDLRPLDSKAVPLWRISLAARSTVLVAAILLAELLSDLPVPTGTLTGVATVAVIAAVIAIPPMRYSRWGFGFREDHLRLRHGVLFRTTSIVPYARIQHVDTQHGPIDRWLDLASLVVYTAGTRGAILTIPALEHGEAEEVRDRLASLSGTGDAV